MAFRFLALAVKETRELIRDPVYLGLSFVVPIVLMLIFGYGFTMDVKHLPVAVIDEDRSPLSREYIDAFTNSEYFDLVATPEDRGQAAALLHSGDARIIVTIPANFSRHLTGWEPVVIGLWVDGSYPTRASVATGYMAAINAQFNQRLIARWLIRQPALTGMAANSGGSGNIEDLLPVSLNLSVWYNPSLDSKNFIIPGMMVIILMLFPALLGALLIVREKEMGTIFNLYSSPIRRWEILAGKALPYVGVAFLDYLLLFAMARWLFEVRFVGSFWVLSTGALLYSVCTIGIGLLISCLMRSQLSAMLLTFLVTMTPAFNYSGFLAPVASQDMVGQTIARFIPATYFMDMLRGTFLKGLGFDYYWPAMLALSTYTVVIYALAWLFLNKRIG